MNKEEIKKGIKVVFMKHVKNVIFPKENVQVA